MLIIRKEQMEVFDTIFVNRFRDSMLKHFKENFPEETQYFTQDQMNRFILDGVNEGYEYGLTSKQDLCVFLNVKILLKVSGPISESEHDWAVDILNNDSLDSPAARIKYLSKSTDLHLENL